MTSTFFPEPLELGAGVGGATGAGDEGAALGVDGALAVGDVSTSDGNGVDPGRGLAHEERTAHSDNAVAAITIPRTPGAEFFMTSG